MYREVIPSSSLSRIRALTPIVNDAIYGLNAQRYGNLLSLVKTALSNTGITNDAKGRIIENYIFYQFKKNPPLKFTLYTKNSTLLIDLEMLEIVEFSGQKNCS